LPRATASSAGEDATDCDGPALPGSDFEDSAAGLQPKRIAAGNNARKHAPTALCDLRHVLMVPFLTF
jgi:hypothetical protein